MILFRWPNADDYSRYQQRPQIPYVFEKLFLVVTREDFRDVPGMVYAWEIQTKCVSVIIFVESSINVYETFSKQGSQLRFAMKALFVT